MRGIVMQAAALFAAAVGGAACAQDEARPVSLRVATFNLEDVRTADLVRDDLPRLRRLAEVIQRVRPNIILLNEIAYDAAGAPDVPAGAEPGQNAARFVEHYLGRAQGPGLEPLSYIAFMAPTNTGMPSGFDLDNSGGLVSEYPNPPPAEQTDAGRAFGGDCWGFGTFPGQYGMALLVDDRLELRAEEARTFRLLPWDYVPGAFLPKDPETGEPWYSEAEVKLLRLSSKSHWDVPVGLGNGRVLHVLCSHPTPPAFDGPEMRNQKRNFDEIRFWSDYLDNEPYIVDDTNRPGGLALGEAFVILGDLNADPDEGSSFKNPIERHLLLHRRVEASHTPTSALEVPGLDPDDTARFKLRVDYVLPSRGIEVLASGIWREPPTTAGGGGFPSDHFPVWADIRVPPPLPATDPPTVGTPPGPPVPPPAQAPPEPALTRISPATVHPPELALAEAPGWRAALAAYVQTTKPGITKLVTITSMVGLGMGFAARWNAGDGAWSAPQIAMIVAGSIVGTALSAAGANALNQWAERERDAKMRRTARRPIPSGRLSARQVLVAGLSLAVAGVALLWAACGGAPAAVAAACVLVYVLLYTPMKAATWTATLVGAIPGALPPLIGWSAAYADRGFASLLDAGGLGLFALMFIWQLPHFLAIAWMYRDDYALGGCAVLPVVDRTGERTALVIAGFTVLLVPATIAPVIAMPQVLGLGSLLTAAGTGLAFAGLVARLLRTRRREHARSVFFASIIHLPVLLAVMVVDAFAHSIL